MKRAFDLFFAIPGLLILLPIFVVIAIWIKIDSPGTIFFRQERVGKDGKPFRIYKFRTMVNNAEQMGPSITVGNDPRITKAGRVLRKHKLDELPQLINVVKGEMSLVGPRPEVPYYVSMYSEEQRRVLSLTPGITDPASIKYKDENKLLAAISDRTGDEPEMVYIREIMPEKFRINLEYSARANVVSDFMVVMRTLFDSCVCLKKRNHTL